MTEGQQPAPLVTGSFVVDPGCTKRMARATSRGMRGQTTRYFGGLFPAAIVGVLSYHLRSSSENSPAAWGIAILVGAGTWIVLSGLFALVSGHVGTSVTKLLDNALMPPGFHYRVDYYSDRMVAHGANDLDATTMYSDIERVVVKPQAVLFYRNRGVFALPIEVVPPAAQQLIIATVPHTASG